MKKLLVLSTLLLTSIALTCQGNNNAPTRTMPIALDSTVLNFVDGTSFIDVGNIFTFGKNILMLLNGAKDLKYAQSTASHYNFSLPKPLVVDADTGVVPVVFYKDRYYTVKEMVEIEKSGTEDPSALHAALMHAGSHFEKLSEDYVEEIQVAKHFMVSLIHHWSKLRNRPDTILLTWANVNPNEEKSSMYKTVTSFEKLDKLFSDLLLFLADLVQNCPKSHKNYRLKLQQQGGH